MANSHSAYLRTASHEGGYNGKASDKGNYCDGQLIGTMYGVTASVYKEHFKLAKCPTIEQLKSLTKAQAEEIFVARYWNPVGGSRINNQSIAELIVDFAFNSGNYTAVLNVQQALAKMGYQVKQDGVMGPVTLGLINSAPQERLHTLIKAEREALFRALAASNSNYAEWLKGWLIRLNQFVFQAPAVAPASTSTAG